MSLINFCCFNSTYTVHQGLLSCFTLYIAFWGYTIQTLTTFLWGANCLVVSGGAAVHGPNVIWSTPPLYKNPPQKLHGWNPHPCSFCGGIAHVWWIEDVPSRVSLHCTFPKSIVQAYKCGDCSIHQRDQVWCCFAEVWNFGTSMGVVPHCRSTSGGGWL